MLERKKNVDAVNSSATAVSRPVQQCQNLITHLIEDFIKRFTIKMAQPLEMYKLQKREIYIFFSEYYIFHWCFVSFHFADVPF